MKTKSYLRKLTLNKRTVSDLDFLTMNSVRGKGTLMTCYYTCDPCETGNEHTCYRCPDVDTMSPTCVPCGDTTDFPTLAFTCTCTFTCAYPC
jgi:hypothetical protein